jgi:hypothetical protein
LLQIAKNLQHVNARIERPGSCGRFATRAGYRVLDETKSVVVHPGVRRWFNGNVLDENERPREYPMTVRDGAISLAVGSGVGVE